MLAHWRGVELASLPSQFEPTVPGRVLVLDGDGPAYRAAAKAAQLPTAMRRYVTLVLEEMYLANCTEVRIHLTAKGCKKAHRGLYPTFWEYQSKRSGRPKPPLLEPLRQAIERAVEQGDPLIPEGWWTQLHHYWEADDGIIMDGVVYGDNCVIRSDDKDMRITQAPFMEPSTGKIDYIDNRYGWLGEAYTPSGKLKVTGHGTKFFWAQMLMGDKADTVRGLDRLDGALVGESGTLKFLMPIMDENEAANAVLAAYARNKQNPLAEAEMLWLRRSETDSAYRYISELELLPPYRQWIEDLHGYHLQVLEQKKAEMEMEDE